jgi:hypothetical protein
MCPRINIPTGEGRTALLLEVPDCERRWFGVGNGSTEKNRQELGCH